MPENEKKKKSWRDDVPPYRVIRDNREQQGWEFPAIAPCLGLVGGTLKTGDYTLEGYESQLCIERKRSTGEICTNLTQDRFLRELERMDVFRWPFLVCEFTLADIVSFPENSTIPRERWQNLRMSPQFMLKRLNEINIRYRTRIIFAGAHGRDFCSSLFKRVMENEKLKPYQDQPTAVVTSPT